MISFFFFPDKVFENRSLLHTGHLRSDQPHVIFRGHTWLVAAMRGARCLGTTEEHGLEVDREHSDGFPRPCSEAKTPFQLSGLQLRVQSTHFRLQVSQGLQALPGLAPHPTFQTFLLCPHLSLASCRSWNMSLSHLPSSPGTKRLHASSLSSFMSHDPGSLLLPSLCLVCLYFKFFNLLFFSWYSILVHISSMCAA